jgi:hypothetical protein
MSGVLSIDIWSVIVVFCTPLTLVKIASTCRKLRGKFSQHPNITKWKTLTPDEGLFDATKCGHRDLVDLFIAKGATNWNTALCYASRGGHRELVDLFITKGANDWNLALYYAARGGHRELVDLFISKRANDWNYALHGAKTGGHRELVDLFIAKGARATD